MIVTVLVNVRCGSCGRLAGRIVDVDGRIAYRNGIILPSPSPSVIFCADHGWADLADAPAKIDRARAAGKPATLRARCSRQRVIP